MHCTHNAVFFNPQNCQFLYTNYWLIHFHSWVKKYFCKSRYMYIWPRKNNYLLFFCCLSWPDMTFNKSTYLQNQNSQETSFKGLKTTWDIHILFSYILYGKGFLMCLYLSFLIACATILCGGLDFQVSEWNLQTFILTYMAMD